MSSILDMETKMEEEINGQAPSKVQTLNLSNCKSKDIKGLSADFISLESLAVKNAGLRDLSGLPKLPKLIHLDLEGNELDDSQVEKIADCCPNLERLSLKENPIKDVSKLKALARLTKLTDLDLTGCDLGETGELHQTVTNLLPNVKNLNQSIGNGLKSVVKNGESDDDAEEEDDEEDDDDDSPGLKALANDLDDDEDEEDDGEFEGAEEEDSDDDEDEDDEEDEDVGALSPPSKTTPITGKRKRPQNDD